MIVSHNCHVPSTNHTNGGCVESYEKFSVEILQIISVEESIEAWKEMESFNFLLNLLFLFLFLFLSDSIIKIPFISLFV